MHDSAPLKVCELYYVYCILQASMHPEREKVTSALYEATLEKGYRPDRTRQESVFDHVHWDTFEKDVVREGKSGKQVRGKIFEMFIQADPEFGERSALEKELLDLAHSPEKYNLGKELGHHRNPDMAFLIVQKEEGIEIIGVGESKLGLLNERSYKQLDETGFAKGVKALVEVVNNLEHPEQYGLVEVAKAKKQLTRDTPLLTIAQDFTQLLVVPANRHIEWTSTLINRREFSAEGRKKFYELLQDVQKVRTARAAFSTAEISSIADTIYDSPNKKAK